jgi:hypothetical protein
MNAERTFTSRLRQLITRGYEPAYVVLVLDDMETTLLNYQTTVMEDKQMPFDEKGRHAQVITAMINSVRRARVQVPSSKDQLEDQPKRQLHNSHLI